MFLRLKKPWQIVTRIGAVDVSTVELMPGFSGLPYETLLFFDDGTSKQVDSYVSRTEAREGHNQVVQSLGSGGGENR